ncbi:MAG: DUF4249 family protein [Bacteroidales bacterium]|nr:DUF4249 family protein [Bacteroidales bacterium]MBP5689769.1 DUF4249 family protein [Bacteroidales bacterium]
MRRILLILALLTAVSCVETFVPEIKEADVRRVVVDAVLTTDTTAHCVRLSASAPYGTPSESIPVISGASVRLSDGTREIDLKEDPGTGCYYTPDDYAGEVGKTYTLSIDTEDQGEAIHLEAKDKMPPCGVRADAFDYYKMTDSLWVFAIWGQDLPGIISHYAADLRVNGEGHGYGRWVFIDGYQMFDGNYLNGGEYLFYSAFDPLGVTGEETPPLKEGDVVEVYFYSLSDFFYSFMTAMMSESIAHMPLFSPQPANLPTNINGDGTGVFALAYRTKMSLVIGNPDRTRLEMLADHGMLPKF